MTEAVYLISSIIMIIILAFFLRVGDENYDEFNNHFN